MPISVLCPDCSAPVNAPDSAAGRRAKCPKCGGIMVLPEAEIVEDDFEVVEEPTRKKKPRVVAAEDDDERPKKKSSKRVVVEDDEEEGERPPRTSRRQNEDNERPRKKGRGKKKTGGVPIAVWIGSGLTLLAVVGVGLYFAFAGKKESAGKGGGGPGQPVAQKPALPPGWVPFQDPLGAFTALFPKPPDELPVPNPSPQAIKELKMWQTSSDGGRLYQLIVESFREAPPGDPPPNFLDQLCDGFSAPLRQTLGAERSRVDATLGGVRAKELTFSGSGKAAVIRLAYANKKIVALSVIVDGGAVPADEFVKAYFDNFQLK